MENSNNNSTPPSNHKHRRLALVLLGLAPIGFFDSTYLAVEHFLNRIPPCTIVNGCEKVATSSYSVFFGIPVALMGAAYYLVIILALVYYLDTRREWVLKWTACFTAVGFLFSLWLVYLMFFVLKAICSWCMLSAFSSTALFILGLLVLRSFRKLKMNHMP